MASTKLKGNVVGLSGTDVNVGDTTSAINVVNQKLENIQVGGKKDKVQVIVVVPSLDTAVCASEARRFNEEASKVSNTEVTIVSQDLPFAMGRFCTTEGIENLNVGSDFRSKEFSNAYGLTIADGVLAGLSARAVFVIDTKGVVIYKELCEEITAEPDYEAVLKVIK
ncbi:MAG: Thiol peroxidase, Tpx-type (EC [uncultured Campylobacterales bacterium]|uniref:Thiol peroxidase, Tpx-type (EC) n=1 Tax=uncultured Campylobacterales bacterium TaxID=352960 RepID=A0A6S6SQS2_9BACT|nr:MAG: Thiol peroxidase, Tpx-type (EC [uncultured Campylobacterales bacterium]